MQTFACTVSLTACVYTWQFHNAAAAYFAMGRRMLPDGDFTDELSMINQMPQFNDFENKSQSEANGTENGSGDTEVRCVCFHHQFCAFY